jgi:predicted TIM-barrel fold metal-dependent hydrolase
MSTAESIKGSETESSVETLLIDTDVHETPSGGRAMKDLIPYIDPHWQRYLKGEGCRWVGPPAPSSYAQPIATNGVRAEWNSNGVGISGTGSSGSTGNSLDAMKQHLFVDEQVSIGILNGPNFHPSGMQSDPAFAVALASAYNDYQIEHWLEQEPRLRGSVHIAAQRPDLAAREIDRVAEHPQIVQVILPLVTHMQWGDEVYQPIWEAAVRNDLVVAFHHNGATTTVLGWPRYYIEWHTLAAPQAAQNQLVSLICQGTFDRNPDLKVIMLEAGVSWVQWLIWRLDQQYRELRSNVPWVKRLPSEHIRDNVRAATQPMTEVTTEQFRMLVEMTDTERVYVFATDYPHYDADSASAVLPGTLPEELRQRVRYRNAIETYPRLRGLLT